MFESCRPESTNHYFIRAYVNTWREPFAFYKRIMADAETRQIVIETDLTGMAQGKTVAGLPAELCDLHLPELEAQENAQRATADGLCNFDLPE